MSEPEFIVGDTYHDKNGPYQVTSFDGKTVCYKYTAGEYADGTERKGDAAIKWRIECNLRLGPLPSNRSSNSLSSAAGGGFFTHAEAFPIVAKAIEGHSQTHSDYMVHREIVEAVVRGPEGQLIAARRPDKSPRWCAGQMIAWFSKVFTDGRSEYDGRFERKKVGPCWAYRVRRRI